MIVTGPSGSGKTTLLTLIGASFRLTRAIMMRHHFSQIINITSIVGVTGDAVADYAAAKAA